MLYLVYTQSISFVCLFVSGCLLWGKCFISLSYSLDFIETIYCEPISVFYDSLVRIPLESLFDFHNEGVFSLKSMHANEYISIGRGNHELNTKTSAIGLKTRWQIVRTMLSVRTSKC